MIINLSQDIGLDWYYSNNYYYIIGCIAIQPNDYNNYNNN